MDTVAKPLLDAFNDAFETVLCIEEDPVRGTATAAQKRLDRIVRTQYLIKQIEKPLWTYWNICDDGSEREMKSWSLSSHVSQLMALCVPNFLDHYLKDTLGVRHAIRYMDDGVILHNDKAFLADLLHKMQKICAAHGLELNMEKTHITPIRKGVTFLKIRYSVKDGKTVKRLHRSSVVRMRRKLHRFVGLVSRGKMTPKLVRDSFQSWQGHTLHAMAFRQRKNMRACYFRLFGSPIERRCAA